MFSSNGDAFLFHDRTGQSSPVERQIGLDEFPSPEDLWRRYRAWKGFDDASGRLALQPCYEDPGGKELRYYQRAAVQRAVEAVARGRRRMLLVMATGTGKTLTVFQIIWRLWKAGKVRRVLFLVDRNILADQTVTNDFKPFGPVMTKVRDRHMDPSYEVYLALYQAVSGSEEEKNVYKQFSRGFFDLVVIDECHRGSAREDGRLITESLTDYTREAVRGKYATLADFLRRWAGSDRKIVITKNGRPVSRLIPCRKKPDTLFGIDRGKLEILGDFDEPLDVAWEAETGDRGTGGAGRKATDPSRHRRPALAPAGRSQTGKQRPPGDRTGVAVERNRGFRDLVPGGRHARGQGAHQAGRRRPLVAPGASGTRRGGDPR